MKVAPRTFCPSTISTMVAESMAVNDDDVVIDMGCGSGVLSIIAAKLPSSVSEDPAILRMAHDKLIDITQRGSRMIWTARVWEATAH